MRDAQVSVVIPTQDRPLLLEASVRSVLLQTRPVNQIVIVDDGSRDPANVQRVAALDPAITVIRHEVPRGVAAARNSGIAHLDGDFVFFLDDDDLIHPRFVEDGLQLLGERQDADIVVFLAECIFTPDSLGSSFPVSLLFDYKRLPMQPLRIVEDGNAVPGRTLEARPASAFIRYTIPIHSCLLRRAALAEHRFPEELRQGEDTYFWISLAASGRRFVADGRVYVFVRRHPNNTTRSPERYQVEIQPCYEMLLDEGLLRAPEDVFLAHLKLFWFKRGWRDGNRLRHAAHLAGRPRLLANEVRFWLANVWKRRSVLKYYLA